MESLLFLAFSGEPISTLHTETSIVSEDISLPQSLNFANEVNLASKRQVSVARFQFENTE